MPRDGDLNDGKLLREKKSVLMSFWYIIIIRRWPDGRRSLADVVM